MWEWIYIFIRFLSLERWKSHGSLLETRSILYIFQKYIVKVSDSFQSELQAQGEFLPPPMDKYHSPARHMSMCAATRTARRIPEASRQMMQRPLQTHDAESRLLQLLPDSEQEQQFAESLMTKPRAGLFTHLLYSGLEMEQACIWTGGTMNITEGPSPAQACHRPRSTCCSFSWAGV